MAIPLHVYREKPADISGRDTRGTNAAACQRRSMTFRPPVVEPLANASRNSGDLIGQSGGWGGKIGAIAKTRNFPSSADSDGETFLGHARSMPLGGGCD